MYKRLVKNYVDWLHAKARIPGGKGVLVVLTCIAYLGVSSQLIVLNKYLLQHEQFHYPLLLSNMGMMFTFLASFSCIRFGIIPYQVISYRDYVSRFVPLGFWTAASIGLGNISSLYLDMGLVEMLKGFSPVVVLAVSFTLGLEKLSWLPVLATSLMAAGTVTTAATGVSAVSSFGLVVHFASHLCEALKVCMAQLYMCNMNMHQIQTLQLMSAACSVFLMLGVAAFEWRSFVENKGWGLIQAHPHLYLAAASMGFCVNVLAYCVIKLAGSITQKVLGTVKNVILVVVSVFMMGEHLTARQWMGYQCSLLGFIWFQYLKLAPSVRSDDANKAKKIR